MTPEIIYFGMGLVVGAGMMGFAMLLAVVMVGLGIRIEDFLSAETNMGAILAWGAFIGVILLVVLSTQYPLVEGAKVMCVGNKCYP